MHERQGSRLPRRGRIVVAGVALLALAGCDRGVSGLGAQSVELLHERVAAVRTAADTEDRAAALAAVDAFRAEVRRLLDAGELTEAEAAGLLAHADAIASGVDAEVVEPTPTPTPQPTPEPTPEPSPEPTPAPTMTPEQVEVLRQQTADQFAEMLRERLNEYVTQQLQERRAQEKAERRKERQREGDKGSGGSR